MHLHGAFFKDFFCDYLQDCALGKRESSICESLIFAGLNSGQIILLEAQQYFMKTPVKAHLGQVSALEYSHGRYDGDSDGIGTADRLMSCGSDKVGSVSPEWMHSPILENPCLL